jgi:hypothetical protein
MSKRTPKLNFAWLNGRPPTVQISDDDWHQIESAYGRDIPRNVRADIEKATNSFVESSAFAKAAAPASKVSDRVKVLHKRAAELLEILCATADDRNDAAAAAQRLIEKNGCSFSLSADAIGALIAATRKAQQELTSSCSSGLSDTDHWELWVRRVIASAKRGGLPSGVRKDRDGDPSWKPSPFVVLIDALQHRLPYPRRALSMEALSQAIAQARKRGR